MDEDTDIIGQHALAGLVLVGLGVALISQARKARAARPATPPPKAPGAPPAPAQAGA